MALLSELTDDVKDRFKGRYRALCQNENCKEDRKGGRTQVGWIHMVGLGVVDFVCCACGTVSEFENTANGYTAKVVGNIDRVRRSA